MGVEIEQQAARFIASLRQLLVVLRVCRLHTRRHAAVARGRLREYVTRLRKLLWCQKLAQVQQHGGPDQNFAVTDIDTVLVLAFRSESGYNPLG
jgi:hypothetical protein